jgi:hypothetical protein
MSTTNDPTTHRFEIRAGGLDDPAVASLVFEGAADNFGINDPALPFDNLYLYIDDTEVGSLWPHRNATGEFTVTLGTFGPLPEGHRRPDDDTWYPLTTLAVPTPTNPHVLQIP